MTGKYTFTTSDRQLLILDAASGKVRWHEKPLELPVEQVEPIGNSGRALVLLDYMAAPGPIDSLVCVDCDGRIVWRARLPTNDSTDAYVSFELADGQICANTWSGHRVILDPASGDVLSSYFTK